MEKSCKNCQHVAVCKLYLDIQKVMRTVVNENSSKFFEIPDGSLPVALRRMEVTDQVVDLMNVPEVLAWKCKEHLIKEK